MAPKKTIKNNLDSFIDLKDVKDLIISKSSFSIEDISDMLKMYIEAVWFFHFKNKMQSKKYDEDIDTKLKWVYECNNSIIGIINDLNKPKSKK